MMIGIITALEKEFAAVRAVLPRPQAFSVPGRGAGRRYLLSELRSADGGKHSIVLTLAEMGNNMAAARATLLMEHFPDLSSIIMVGIAGGVPNPRNPAEHVRLGDIVVSNHNGVIQYDFDKETATTTIHRHPPRPPDAALLEAVKLLQAGARRGRRPWLRHLRMVLRKLGIQRPPNRRDILTRSENSRYAIPHPFDSNRTPGEPRIFLGPVASANKLLKHSKKRDQLGAAFGVKAIEMEGSGIADASWNLSAGYLVIRGICDYCDSKKNDLWQDYAAAAAAGYTRALLESIPSSHRSRVSWPSIESAKPSIWQMPQEQNPFFCGRERYLKRLSQHHQTNQKSAQPKVHVIYGLGGMGKTQVAIEYAYRQSGAYRAVLWAAAGSRLTLRFHLREIAHVLGVSISDIDAPSQVPHAVKSWFAKHQDWLLIIDNADDLEVLQDLWPLHGKGHVIVTTRNQQLRKLGTVEPMELTEMNSDEAVRFMIRRVGPRKSIASERTAAAKLVHRLGYLPLAMEQAAAFIRGKAVRFQDYLTSYEKHSIHLLSQSAPATGNYPHSLLTAWSMNLSEVQMLSASAFELLYFCSVLAADRIPLRLLVTAAAAYGGPLSTALSSATENPLLLSEVLEPLKQYSLIRHDIASHTISVHPLVQEVLTDQMTRLQRVRWVESAISAFNIAYAATGVNYWASLDDLLPHVRRAAELVLLLGLQSAEIARMLYQAGQHCYNRSQFQDAEWFTQNCIMMHEQSPGAENVDLAVALNQLGAIYRIQGRLDEAAKLHERALSIKEKCFGHNSLSVAATLHNLADVFRDQKKLSDAERFSAAALKIREDTLGNTHEEVAASLNSLGEVFRLQGRFSQAEEVYTRCMVIREQVFGPDHPTLATTLDHLAMVYYAQGRYKSAEPLSRRSLDIRERLLGKSHLHVAFSLNGLGEVLRALARVEEAEVLLRRSLYIRERVVGKDHPLVARAYENLGNLMITLARYPEARKYLIRSLEIRKRALGPDHPDVATSLTCLADLDEIEGHLEDARTRLQQSLKIREQHLRADHPDLATTLTHLGNVLSLRGEVCEAERMLEHALRIREQQLGPAHPYIAYTLTNLARINMLQARFKIATTLYQRALSINLNSFGPQHPAVARNLYELAVFQIQRGKYVQARAGLKRALEIFQVTFGRTHRDYVQTRKLLSQLA